jgi:PhnB protein
MKGFNPYLNFNGNCREAIEYYKSCFNGEIESMMTFAEAGDAGGNDPSYAGKIMHAVLRAGSIFLMASDCPPGASVQSGTNITLNIDFADAGTQDKVFNKLATGGKITMPLQDTFWGSRFGMLVDKFGVNWMVNCELKK